MGFAVNFDNLEIQLNISPHVALLDFGSVLFIDLIISLILAEPVKNEIRDCKANLFWLKYMVKKRGFIFFHSSFFYTL